jgi:flagellar biosynthesis protein FlhB
MSEDADESSKTEEATGKKLEKAHSEGQWPLTPEIAHALAIGAMLILVMSVVPWLVPNTKLRLTYYLEHIVDFPMDRSAVGGLMERAVLDTLYVLWLPILFFVVAGVYATVFQKGFRMSWKVIAPKFSKLNPINGFKNLFSLAQQGVELAKSLTKMAVVAGVAYIVMRPLIRQVDHWVGIELLPFMIELNVSVRRLLFGVFLVVASIAVFDYFYQRFTYNKKMRMTKQEVKDEHKQSEGDPQVKARIRRIRMERVRKRMMAAVPTADVVVTNPTHFAVALKYDPETMNAPTVVAKGADVIAMRIREIATENGVPIMPNPPLARALYAAVEIDQEVPAEHYRAVAEVITYVMKLRQRSGRS